MNSRMYKCLHRHMIWVCMLYKERERYIYIYTYVRAYTYLYTYIKIIYIYVYKGRKREQEELGTRLVSILGFLGTDQYASSETPVHRNRFPDEDGDFACFIRFSRHPRGV